MARTHSQDLLFLLLREVCPLRPRLRKGLLEGAGGGSSQGGIYLGGGRRRGRGPANLPAHPKVAEMCVERRPAKGLGQEVRGIELPLDLVQRHGPITHELLHPQLANRKVPNTANAGAQTNPHRRGRVRAQGDAQL